MNEIKYIVFDRDGTLIEHIPYLYKPKDVKLLSNVKETIKNLKSKNYKIFLHTNQSGIARGMFEYSDAIKCNEKLVSLIGVNNLFDDICVADELNFNFENYRKPSPKFGLEILSKYNVDSSKLTYVGDSICDLNTAKNLNCNFIGLNTGLIKFEKKTYSNGKFKYPIFDNISKILKVL